MKFTSNHKLIATAAGVMLVCATLLWTVNQFSASLGALMTGITAAAVVTSRRKQQVKRIESTLKDMDETRERLDTMLEEAKEPTTDFSKKSGEEMASLFDKQTRR